MKAALISIGDEILIGQIVNTNSVWIAQQLNQAGISVVSMLTVGDETEAILSALEQTGKVAELVIITGGLGPTRDDVTKKALCQFMHCELVTNHEVLKDVEEIFSKRGRKLNQFSRDQALVPAGCHVIRNALGTAPGIWISKNETHYFCLPGVPYEMKPMVSDFIIPQMQKLYKLPSICHRTVLTIGIPESDLAHLIEKWEDGLALKQIKLAYLPQPGQVRLRLSTVGSDREKVLAMLDEEIAALQKIAGKFIYGQEVYGEAEVGPVQILFDLLNRNGKTVSLAESCTGGFLSSQLTLIAGASAVFKGAIVPYTNTAKNRLLEVDHKIFEKHGAVSEECVRALAENVLKRFGSDYSIAISGIAGPTGGTDLKPVGTVWIAVSNGVVTQARKYRFGVDRWQNIVMSANAAADQLRRLICGND